jgi:hypothetical protein
VSQRVAANTQWTANWYPGGKPLLDASVEIDILITLTYINVKRRHMVLALNRGMQNSRECAHGVLDSLLRGERGKRGARQPRGPSHPATIPFEALRRSWLRTVRDSAVHSLLPANGLQRLPTALS